MKIKSLLLGTTLAAGALLVGTHSASAAEQYTIQSGDTLASISQKYAGNNSLIQTIADDNNIANIDLIYVGENLTINADGTSTAAATTTATTEVAATVETAPVATTETATAATTTTATTSSAKEWIAQKESGGSYTATNGQYIGRYQLSASYLNGDYSAANQEAVADSYVASRYGSWEAAQSFWLANGWY
jgi:LysM repeat protein